MANQDTRNHKILAYLIGSLGDTIMAIPALRAVKKNFPSSEITILHDFQGANLVTPIQILPDDLVSGNLAYNFQVKGWRKALELLVLARKIRKQKFDAAVYLVISERPAKSVRRDKFFFQLCNIKKFFGFHALSKEEIYPFDVENRPAISSNEASRKLQRLNRDGIETETEEDLTKIVLKYCDEEKNALIKWLEQNRKKPASRLVAFAPGCKTTANIWDIEKFAELGKRFLMSEDCEIIIIGGKNERHLGDKLVASWGEGINAVGDFPVRESGILLSLCDLFVGLDTGTTHLAAAAGVSCLAIYGERNNPGQWFPLGKNHLIVYHPVDCAGCRLLVCTKENHPCMKQISVENVWRTFQNFQRERGETKTENRFERIAV